MINFNKYKLMSLSEVGEFERAKKGKIYKAGSTLIQLSATRGYIKYLSRDGEVEMKYAVLTPDHKHNAYYIHTSIKKSFPEFFYREKTGMNLQFDTLRKMCIAIHDRETQDYIAQQAAMIDDAISKEKRAIELVKDIKKFFLEGMFV